MPHINYKVTLKDTQTGEVRTITQDYGYPEFDVNDPENEHYIWFYWEEGNYACDCNRYTVFYDDGIDYPCGGRDNRFELVGLEFEDGSQSEKTN